MVKKAVITAAGLGTRLYPATKIVKKELFPVIDRDGLVKPIIQIIVEELVQSGIEQIGIVIQPEDKPVFHQFFHQPLPSNFAEQIQNKPIIIEQTKHILELGKRISFVYQDKQDGFGHAVYCAREFVGHEPFILLLGDHVSHSKIEISCVQQLLNVYQRYQKSVVGVLRTAESLIYRFGTVGAKPICSDPGVFEITEFKEKPTIEYAQKYLRVEGLGTNQYLCLFGQYILTPRIFEHLQYHIDHNLREQNEIQLTSALEKLRKQEGFFAYEIQGERYDIGVPEGYLETILALGKANYRSRNIVPSSLQAKNNW
ncbi:MAG: sugar phosphate nucleotidyltransferase [bacterium]|nr:sugar phosphate nucleotidyltransferase [bacterium]